MKEYFLIFGAIVLFLIIGVFLADAIGLLHFGIFAPAQENIRREVFENTKSYNEGKEQDLTRYRLQYLRAETEEEKEALASTIRLMFADYDANKLEPVLRDFLIQIRKGGK